MNDNKVICGDCIKVLPTLGWAKMIFADPPDNLGVKYVGGVGDRLGDNDYIDFLLDVVYSATGHKPDSFWMSHYHSYTIPMLNSGIDFQGYNAKLFMWRFTFGQHRETDCGNGYRPILRLSVPDMVWNTNSIRVKSARLEKYNDKRANLNGKVPDDVWEFPRVCGTHKERRGWIPNQHPEGLIERMILMSTNPGDLVIDMFGGSGTVHRVCKRLGRRSISIEISEEYVKNILSENNM